MPLPRHLSRTAPLLAALAILLTYSNHFHNAFHFDDIHTIVDNPAIRSLHNLPRFFTDATTFSVLPANRTWRPILTSTLALDYALACGYNPVWFHLDSFLFFLLQLACMFSLFSATLNAASPTPARNRLIALFATTWYGVHPAIAETVNYIIQRGDILSTLGVVAALALYVRAPSLRRTGLYLLPLALGILAKPPALVFPALLLAWFLLFAPTESRTPRAPVHAIVPSLVLTAAILMVEAHLTPKSYIPATVSSGDYLLTQPFVALRYFVAFFLPVHLNVDTDLVPFSALTPEALSGFVFVAALIAGIAFTARRQPLRPVAFGLLWFLIGLLPTSLYPLSEVENDHRMYLPFVGLVFAVSCALALPVQRILTGNSRLVAQTSDLPLSAHSSQVAGDSSALGRRSILAAALLLLGAYGYGTHHRNAVWRTEETLWADDIGKSPHNGRGLMIYGLTQMQKGDLPRALDYFQRALVYTPNYATLEINLGVVYAALAQPTGAETHFLRALALTPTDDQPHLYYGRFLLEQSRLAEAASQLRTAILLNPARLEPHTLLAETYAAQGNLAAARDSAAETLAFAPGDPAATALLASLNRRTVHPPFQPTTPEDFLNQSLLAYNDHRYPDAIASARRAIALRPNYAEAWNNIGAADAALAMHDPALYNDAIEADSNALRLRPDFPLARNNLAWAIQQKQLAANPAR